MLMAERCRMSCVERKYLLWPEETRPFVEALEPLRADDSLRRDEWRMTTAYLDRADGSFARDALACPDLHPQLRLREYFRPDGASISPYVWVECKERDGGVSLVNRFQLRRELVSRFLDGDLEPSEILACQERFVEPRLVLRAIRVVRDVAGPQGLQIAGAVAYTRSTIEGGSPLARLTIDRDISYHLALPSASLRHEQLGPAALAETACIVEVKQRGPRRPSWCERLLGDLSPAEYSKYLILSALALSQRMAQNKAAARQAV